ncbi:transglutaminase domain-containing protein [Flavobacterium litorale]|uniref:DUF3857 domain-containing protein n=1 Tax=Flavobacterium litorale TaxID=2856519 RepID=A0ABX8VB47_9FLAO|nr:transglutaminase domain-containing protein [Flavobacterium litorale]QYJ68035.1 DUF3857 domain-containing protein [Flavobacterium litorale]
MKKIVLLLFLISGIVNAQDTNKVWDLLLKNDRQGARQAFDTTFKKQKDDSIELLVLDALIDKEMGTIYFDETFLKKMTKIEESENYLYPLWYEEYALGSPNSDGFTSLSYKKLDFVAGVDKYKSYPIVIYNKAIYDRRRLDFDAYKESINKLDAITKWQFCGVFENMNGSGLDIDYEPEHYAKNDKMFNANSNGIVNWYVPAIPQNEGYHFYYNEAEYGNGIIYAQSFIESDKTREVVLNLGTSGPIKVFVNDIEIYTNDKAVTTDLNAFHVKFNLLKGTNRLLIKSATDGNNDYFYAAIKDVNQNTIPALKYYDTYKPYNKATLEALNANEINPFFEDYLVTKLAKQPDSVFYTLLLYNAYIYNHKYEKAYKVIQKLTEKYPNSSLLKVELVSYYTLVDDSQKVEELNETLLLKDEDYYYSIATKIQDGNWTRKANISELEKYRDKAKKLNSEIFGQLYDFMITTRNADIDNAIKQAEEILDGSYDNENLVYNFASLYSSLKKDKEKTISIYEDIVSKREDITAQNALINYYQSVGRKEDVKAMVKSRIKHYSYLNSFYEEMIALANQENDYEFAIKNAEIGLANFPYSFDLMEKMGMAYNALKDTKKAEEYFKKSLTHYSSNSTLRKRLYDITKVPDEIDQVVTKNIYDLIKERRGSEMNSNYGVSILLDQYIVNVLPEGSRETKSVLVYQVTAENGIEELKEFNLARGNSLNIIKAEIVKPDGNIVPGEKNYNTIVFTNLAVNDVVYIEYENAVNGYGRFYKDFTETYTFNGAYPVHQALFSIIYPENVTFAYDVMNGEVPNTTQKINGRNCITWEKKNIPTMPLYESFSPEYNDIAMQIRISSIKSWSDISNWYADLVKKNLDMDRIALETYDEIFPKGVTNLTEEEIAYKIYEYIENNITYSSLDFRQSGYVPQKPSKTISTKLGDCKDVSTLFVAMAQKAGLKANLVLVLTSDNGTEGLKLPAINFNHCIVKVNFEDKDYFIELTDKYLPFKTMPMSLYNAKALVVSFDKKENEKSKVINVPANNKRQNIKTTTTTIKVADDVKYYTSRHQVKGLANSYYNELFSEATTADVRNKEFEESINSKLNKVVLLQDAKLIGKNDKFKDEMNFEIQFSVTEKLQSVGSLKIMEIPYLDKVYTRDVIAKEKRNFDILYTRYEDANEYDTEVILTIEEGKKFTEIPENKTLSFKKHQYSIKYELVNPTTLKVTRKVQLPWDTITTEEYAEYKKYVEEAIAAEESIVGFK